MLIFGISGGAFAAPAEPAPAPADAPTDPGSEQAYEQHMTNGVRLFRLEDFDGALAEFEAAYAKSPKANPLINQALVFRKQSKYGRAVERLELALAKHAASMSDNDKAAAQRTIEELRALFAFATLNVSPSEASVSLDGETPPKDQNPVVLSPGDHEFEASLPGYKSRKVRVRVASGEKVNVDLTLEREMATLRVIAAGKNAPIEIDGQVVGQGNWEGALPAGEHEVRVIGEVGGGKIRLAPDAQMTLDLAKGSGSAGLPPVPKPDPPVKPKKDDVRRGFFGSVNGAILFPLRHPQFFEQPQFDDLSKISSGGYVGVRGGYRVHTYAGFEGLFEYGNVIGPANGAGDQSYSLSSFRLGPLIRLMSPGDTIRFLGTFGGGLAIHLMSYDNLPVDAVCPGSSGDCSSTGVDFFAMTEVGFEVDLDGVLLGLAVAGYVSGTKGMNDFQQASGVQAAIKEPYDNGVLPMLGPRIHFGYGFW